ncbi:hypothetical protein FA13DRAFT_1815353 [Coprinellus micaceus]|uniref:Uncharacterized protein n=1 Tax=Coprinellus micaceus TaxID=71717 RepID=A0A4Y7T6K8_COPMI|nr:hypothetical protein FA13DRAFT_1815353 [Coprinellus micaceus]
MLILPSPLHSSVISFDSSSLPFAPAHSRKLIAAPNNVKTLVVKDACEARLRRHFPRPPPPSATSAPGPGRQPTSPRMVARSPPLIYYIFIIASSNIIYGVDLIFMPPASRSPPKSMPQVTDNSKESSNTTSQAWSVTSSPSASSPPPNKPLVKPRIKNRVHQALRHLKSVTSSPPQASRV